MKTRQTFERIDCLLFNMAPKKLRKKKEKTEIVREKINLKAEDYAVDKKTGVVSIEEEVINEGQKAHKSGGSPLIPKIHGKGPLAGGGDSVVEGTVDDLKEQSGLEPKISKTRSQTSDTESGAGTTLSAFSKKSSTMQRFQEFMSTKNVVDCTEEENAVLEKEKIENLKKEAGLIKEEFDAAMTFTEPTLNDTIKSLRSVMEKMEKLLME